MREYDIFYDDVKVDTIIASDECESFDIAQMKISVCIHKKRQKAKGENMKKNSFTMKEVEEKLDLMVKQGYLKKTKKGYKDSDYVTELLKQGKSRENIIKILEKKRRRRK